jgi:TorA maturation chaperone TorD
MQQYSLGLAFFAKLLTERVNEPLLRELIDQKMMDSWLLPANDADSAKGLALMRQALAQSSTQNITNMVKELDTDFFELFEMSPPKCYVHESVWRSEEKLFNEKETFQVKAWYAKYGLKGTGKHHGPEDHIGVELSFIAHLLYLMEDNVWDADEVHRDIHEFMNNHLMLWGPDCLDEITQNATTDFYKGLGLLAKGTLKALSQNGTQ